jgi:hypothetical protein
MQMARTQVLKPFTLKFQKATKYYVDKEGRTIEKSTKDFKI